MKKSFTIIAERDPESNWLVGEVWSFLAATRRLLTCRCWKLIYRKLFGSTLKLKSPRSLSLISLAHGGLR